MVRQRSAPRPAVLTPGAATSQFRPALLDASTPDGLRDLEALAASNAVGAVHDTPEAAVAIDETTVMAGRGSAELIGA